MRNREDIIADIKLHTKEAEECTELAEKHTKSAEGFKQELKAFDEANK